MDRPFTIKEILEIPLIPLMILGYAILLALYTPIALGDELWRKIRGSRYRRISGGS